MQESISERMPIELKPFMFVRAVCMRDHSRVKSGGGGSGGKNMDSVFQQFLFRVPSVGVIPFLASTCSITFLLSRRRKEMGSETLGLSEVK